LGNLLKKRGKKDVGDECRTSCFLSPAHREKRKRDLSKKKKKKEEEEKETLFNRAREKRKMKKSHLVLPEKRREAPPSAVLFPLSPPVCSEGEKGKEGEI